MSRILSLISERSDVLWDKRLLLMIQAYFEDMARLFRVLLSHAEISAQVWLLVSTSSYAGIEVPVDLILGEIGEEVGWKVKDIRVMRYLNRVSGQQWEKLSKNQNGLPRLRESLVILESPNK